jgi:hypothetical protein
MFVSNLDLAGPCQSLNVFNSCVWKLFMNLKIKAGYIEKNVEIL